METPTYTEMISRFAKIDQYVADETDLTAYVATALEEVQIYLINNRAIKWSTVYDSDNSIYFVDTDGIANNDRQLKKAISLMAISFIYRDNAQNATDAMFWDLYIAYKGEAETLLDVAKLDIDADESGVIDSDEEKTSAQVFFSR
jgi:hypothetical protein